MQFLKIESDMTRDDLESRVLSEPDPSRRYEAYCDIVTVNRDYHVSQSPNAGEVFNAAMQDLFTLYEGAPAVSAQSKKTRLDAVSGQSDLFEHLCQMSETGWNIYNNTGVIPGYLQVHSDSIISDGDDVMGVSGDDGTPVPMETYVKVMRALEETGEIPSDIFSEYSSIGAATYSNVTNVTSGSMSSVEYPLSWANLPVGEITLHSDIHGTSAEFPVYPNGFEDGVQANYETMPEMIYQYEPWQVYTGSGPRAMSFTFDMHRDMWDTKYGHEMGYCERLINFCKATCYAEYRGAAVNTDIVTLYIKGKKIIRGIMTSVKDEWDGESPIGHDGLPLHVKLTLSITEVSDIPLSNSTFYAGVPGIR